MPISAAATWQKLHGSSFKGRRSLVTGGAGFIGSHLVEALHGLGSSVVVIDDLSGGSRHNISEFRGVDLLEASIADPSKVAQAMAGAEIVFHLAALGSVPGSMDRPRVYHDINDVGTLNVLEAARASGTVQRLIFAASSSAYGPNPVPWVETMPVLPCSPYAANKVAAEAMLRAYSASYGLDTVSLRYFNIFGPRQNANSAYAAVIAAFAKALHAGRPPVIHGDGEQSRDFTFVHNAVHANLLAARHEGKLAGEVLNIGCGGRISVNELAGLMSQLFGRPAIKPVHESERVGDLKHSFADLAKVRAALGYEPQVSFRQGLEETVRWYQQVL